MPDFKWWTGGDMLGMWDGKQKQSLAFLHTLTPIIPSWPFLSAIFLSFDWFLNPVSSKPALVLSQFIMAVSRGMWWFVSLEMLFCCSLQALILCVTAVLKFSGNYALQQRWLHQEESKMLLFFSPCQGREISPVSHHLCWEYSCSALQSDQGCIYLHWPSSVGMNCSSFSRPAVVFRFNISNYKFSKRIMKRPQWSFLPPFLQNFTPISPESMTLQDRSPNL